MFDICYGYAIHCMSQTLSLPEDLLELVEEVMDKSKLGYSNKTEFIKESVRLHAFKILASLHNGEREFP